MPRLREIMISPNQGHADRLWGGEAQMVPGCDAVARSARPVEALYSEALSSVEGADGPRATLSVTIARARGEGGDIQVSFLGEPFEPGQEAFAHVSAAAGRYDARTRAVLVLAIVDTAVRRLAVLRGWDPDLVKPCRRAVLDADLVYRWSSPWRTSPDRRHRARADYVLGPDDGFARMTLEVVDRDGAPVLTTPPMVASSTRRGMRGSAKTLRWTSADALAVTPLIGHVISPPRLRVERTGARWRVDHDPDVVVRRPHGEGVDDEPPPEQLPDVVTVIGRTSVDRAGRLTRW